MALALLASLGLLMAHPVAALADTGSHSYPGGGWCQESVAWYEQAGYVVCGGYPHGETGKEWVTCRNLLGWSAYREGSWMSGGFFPSKATCPFGYHIVGHGYYRY